jgi:uncharacterized RDD family membrane protein YckC
VTEILLSDSESAYAEWYVWSKREVSSEDAICAGAAAAAMLAIQEGASREEAVSAARRSTAGQTITLGQSVPPRRRRYAEWYDWSRRTLGGEPARLHAAARAAIDAFERGESAEGAVAAARVAVTPFELPTVAIASLSPADTGGPIARAALAGPRPIPPAKLTYMYGGLGRRLVAALIDTLIFVTAGYALGVGIILVTLMTGVGSQPFGDPLDAGVGFLAAAVFSLLMGWAYYAALESSALQATLGKAMLGVVVTDSSGRRISFARATGRFWLKQVMLLTVVIAIADAIVLTVDRRQRSLHDLAAGTLVVKRAYQQLLEEMIRAEPQPGLTPGPPPPPRTDPFTPVRSV